MPTTIELLKDAKIRNTQSGYLKNLIERLNEVAPEAVWVDIGSDGKTKYRIKLLKSYVVSTDLPAHEESCACTHEIDENCYVAPYDLELGIIVECIVVVGNECIKRFFPDKKCLHCRKDLDNDKKNNLCTRCLLFEKEEKKEEKKEINKLKSKVKKLNKEIISDHDNKRIQKNN